MFNRVKHLRFPKSKFLACFNQLRSSLAQDSTLRKCKELPNGIVLEDLNLNVHDLGKVRKVLVDAFVLNQEPIMHTLCERAFSGKPVEEKMPKIRRHFEKFFSDQFLIDKIEQGLSVVAIEKGATNRYISSAFAERYCGETYNTDVQLLRDPFWECGLQLMGDLHEQARPFLARYDPKKIAFISHAVTCPELANSGIMITIIDLILSRLAERGFNITLGVLTTKRSAKLVENVFGYLPIAEISYADYEINGEKVFAHLAETAVSAKAMVKYL